MASAAAYVPLTFDPGEAYQIDWSHEIVEKVAHVRLYHSRMLFVRAYPRETQEIVFEAHPSRDMCDAHALPGSGQGLGLLWGQLHAAHLRQRALSEGGPAASVIIIILARHREPTSPLTIDTPAALRLTCEPVADCKL